MISKYLVPVMLAALVALMAAVVIQSLRLETARGEVQAAEQVAEDNAKAALDIARNMDQINELRAEVRELSSRLDQRRDRIVERIVNAPPEANGDLPPVVSDTARELRDAARAYRDGDEGGGQ